jgi:aminopeptidase N
MYGGDTLQKQQVEDREKVFAYAKQRQAAVVDTTVGNNFMRLINTNSYQRGGWVLHMLRHQLTDTVFWNGIRNYYRQYGGRNANTDDFRKVMEQESGTDLQTFFRQWLHTAALPQLKVSVSGVNVNRTRTVTIEQQQQPLFSFPLEYTVGNGEIHHVDIANKVTLFRIPAEGVLLIDPAVQLLAEIKTVR